MLGDTPKPLRDVQTGRFKWAEMIRRADALGADFISTGHYARLRQENGRLYPEPWLGQKQGSVLRTLGGHARSRFARTLFPLADLTKPESREIAHRFNLPVAGKT